MQAIRQADGLPAGQQHREAPYMSPIDSPDRTDERLNHVVPEDPSQAVRHA